MIKLEEICGYLPFGLQLKCNAIFRPNRKELPKIKGASATLTPNLLADIYEGTFDSIGLFKPILRPLPDLVREIEHNGEKFVPYKLLEKEFLMEELLEFKEHKFGWFGFTDNKTNNIPICMDGVIMPECGYGIVKKLYEWHFDLFGLIERGEAIDINTLK